MSNGSVLTQNVDAGAAMVDSLLESLRNSGRKILDKAEAKVRKRRLRSQSMLVENILGSVADVIVGQVKKSKLVSFLFRRESIHRPA